MSATGDDRLARNAGETLIEALAVVAIVGLVAAVAFPRMQQGLLGLSQRQTAAVVTARLRQARAQAMERDSIVVFAVADGGHAYGLTDGAATPTPPGVALTARQGGGGRITFYADGSSTGGVIGVQAARRTIAISVATPGGAVSIAPG
jgi:type II secretory pathway pseudopilin PulG